MFPGAWVRWDWTTDKDWNYTGKLMHDGNDLTSAILFGNVEATSS